MRIALLITLVLAGCLAQPTPYVEPHLLPDPGPDPVRFIAVGDTGTGSAMQQKVADAMEDACIEMGCNFVLLLGDAIYETGVSSPTDPQFQTKFEQAYANFSIPFYVVLGNHDYGGSGLGYEADKAPHYLEYAKTSERWAMPGLTYVVDTGPVDLFALDSGSLAAHGTPIVPPGSSLAEQQVWLAAAIAASDAPWKMTFAHHPYISNGQHGDAGKFDGTPALGAGWRDLMESTACGNVDFHLAGHDHDLQWLKPIARCGDTEFIVSGAGAKQRTAGGGSRQAHFEAYSTQGFAWFEASNTTLNVRFYDDAGHVLMQDSRTRS